jgi:hypothetical protein
MEPSPSGRIGDLHDVPVGRISNLGNVSKPRPPSPRQRSGHGVEGLRAELLSDVLSTAYERQSLVVSTNLPFESWTEVLGSERLTGAALDRLTHRCRILEA